MSVRWSVGAARDLLGRDVGRRAEGLALRFLADILHDLFRQAKIGQHDVVAAVDEEVGRLDVEVDDVGLVRGVQRRDGVAEEPLGMLHVEPAFLLDVVVEVLALDIGHAEKDDVTFLSDVEDGDNVGMTQGGNGARFLLEELDVVGIRRVFRPQHLDGDVALKGGFHRPKNGSHAALGNTLRDDVVAQPGTRNKVRQLQRESHAYFSPEFISTPYETTCDSAQTTGESLKKIAEVANSKRFLGSANLRSTD